MNDMGASRSNEIIAEARMDPVDQPKARNW